MELAPYGVRVNAIEPGFVDTRFASFVTRDPENAPVMLALVVDGGMTAGTPPAWNEEGAPRAIGPGFRAAG
jgi:NAD(P)-dependent dehydrogenase (short-subunit alcohol dehydrogenase family)